MDQNTFPLVLIHRQPHFNFEILNNLLTKHFHLIDPQRSKPSLSLLRSVRAVVIVGAAPFNAEELRKLPALVLAVATTAGTDHIDFEACRGRGISVAGIGDSFTESTADCAVALLIDVLRRVSAPDRFVRSGLWPISGNYPLGSKLGGKRVGIVGLGKIGSAVAKRLVAFGCKIAYNSTKEKPSEPFPYYATARDLAEESDALVVCCALTAKTRHIIDCDVMEALGKDGVIVNVGRGALVDEPELVDFLSRGEIAGAGLDVFENEPYVPSKLFSMDNVVLSPHTELFESVTNIVLANLKAFFSNQPLVSPIQL